MKKQSKQYIQPAVKQQPMRDASSSLESHDSPKASQIRLGGEKNSADVADSADFVCGGNSAMGPGEVHGSPRLGGGVKLDMNLDGIEIEKPQGVGGNTDCE